MPVPTAGRQMARWCSLACLQVLPSLGLSTWNCRECVPLAKQIPDITRLGQSETERIDAQGCMPCRRQPLLPTCARVLRLRNRVPHNSWLYNTTLVYYPAASVGQDWGHVLAGFSAQGHRGVQSRGRRGCLPSWGLMYLQAHSGVGRLEFLAVVGWRSAFHADGR